MLVLSVDREPWRSIELQGQRPTWASPSALDDCAPVRFYRGKMTGPVRFAIMSVIRMLAVAGSARPGSLASRARDRFLRSTGRHFCQSGSRTVNDIITTDVPETYAMVTAKLFAALKHVLATEEFDYLFRTNTSTYVDRQGLLEFAEVQPRSGYWGGFLGVFEGITFTSGTGTLLSRDCVEMALAAEWDWALLDDVALGRVLCSLGIEAQPIARPILESTEEATNADLDAFYWRCKGVHERNDVEIMRELHAVLDSNR